MKVLRLGMGLLAVAALGVGTWACATVPQAHGSLGGLVVATQAAVDWTQPVAHRGVGRAVERRAAIRVQRRFADRATLARGRTALGEAGPTSVRAAPQAGDATSNVVDTGPTEESNPLRDDATGTGAAEASSTTDALSPIELTFVGDIIFGRYREDGYDPIPGPGDDVFGEVTDLMASDLLVGNLETPLVRELPTGSPIVSTYRFGADAELASHLRRGGFGAVSLANNHAFDMRGAGVQQTPEILDELGVVALGAPRDDGPPLRVETMHRKGWRIGFVAITVPANIDHLEGLPPLPRVAASAIAEEVGPVVAAARQSHDVVAVLVHWGQEYAEQPAPRQRRAAHALIDAGADLVIGHHPHVLQGVEHYGGGVIAYSLGNFVFENVKPIPRQTAILRTRFEADGCMSRVVMHPAFVKSVPFKHPAPAVGYLGGKVKARIRAQGQPLGSTWRDEGDALAMAGLGCPATRGHRRVSAAL